MGNMFLSIFLAMALAGLKLWELIDLALPMIVCLVLQLHPSWYFASSPTSWFSTSWGAATMRRS